MTEEKQSAIEKNLAGEGVRLPSPSPVAGNYAPFVVCGNLVFISGQVPLEGRRLIRGQVGGGLSLEEGQEAARLCALNLLAQLKTACGGDLDRVRRCVKLTGFVNAAPGFEAHPQVMNGASDLIVAALGPGGLHSRVAVGAGSLPLNSAVEVDGIFEIAAP